MSRCEVQSPGFTSRLTNIVRARQENPQYSRVGNLPLVRLSKYVDGYYRASFDVYTTNPQAFSPAIAF